MTGFVAALWASFETLLVHPELFLPKIVVAFFYSIPALFLPSLTMASVTAPNQGLLTSLLFWIAYLFAVLVLDILVGTMYPFLVKDFFEKKPVSIFGAMEKSLKNFSSSVPAVLFSELIFIGVVLVLSFPLSLFIVSSNFGGAVATAFFILAIVFFLSVFFYMIFPVVSLEKNSLVGSIKRSFFISKKNLLVVSKATFFSFVLSLAGIALPFAAEFSGLTGFFAGTVVFFALFAAVRFATALIATYQYVLNPVFYLELEQKVVLP